MNPEELIKDFPFKIKKVDHIGIAVKSLDESLGFYKTFLGVKDEDLIYDTVETEGVKAVLFPFGETKFELLEALGPDSPIAKFIDKRGEGIHHISLEVDSIAEAINKVNEDKQMTITENYRIGAGGHKVVFLHPKNTGRVLIELAEH